MVHTEFVVCLCCLYTDFHIPGSSDSLGIVIKWKIKYNFHMAVMLLFYILQKRKHHDQSCIWCEDLLLYRISGLAVHYVEQALLLI